MVLSQDGLHRQEHVLALV